MNSLPSPVWFGLPDTFDKWRPYQSAACELMLDNRYRFILSVCPTGFGKSLTYMTAAKLHTGRTVILTSTKGLQEQLLRDFDSMEGICSIQGRGNYACRLNTRVNCDSGLCMFGVPCIMKREGGCFYYDQVKRARRARIVITNYAYWMSQNEYGEGLGDFDMLVLDEAHAAVDHVIDHVAVRFSRKKQQLFEGLWCIPVNWEEWREWALYHLPVVRQQIEDARIGRREKQFVVLNKLQGKLERIIEHLNHTWIWEEHKTHVTVSPIWPGKLAEDFLFLGIPKVVLTSATIVKKTAELLGIADVDMRYKEFPHSFPKEHRPLIHLPTVRMNYRNGEMEHRLWIAKVDTIIKDRLGMKGIIHTVSYARRDMVLEHSKFRQHMITHQRVDAKKKVKAFKNASAPCILVSPAMVTGWDFPDDECRWQIILKLPYPDMQGAIVKTRAKADKDFINYMVTQQLIQATGRGCRSANDWCETFIIDNNVVWFMDQNKHLLVDWFKDAYRIERRIPDGPLET